ncbi:MAG TPA: ATP-binding cassette domain-containing protein [Abditibacteriaceae bacterium]|nr:ATP-binding cassette domain-containing protein [Abditibacteriaceae bacterium]
MISLKGAGKNFGGTVALAPTDLQIESQKTTALIGPSGCGKSTILKLILGLLHPTSGAVEFEGKRVADSNVLELRRRMGYVIQDGGLFPHLTARQNVLFMAKHLQRPAAELQKRWDELCELTRFPQNAAHRFTVELSGGQRQRVSLMRALMLDPDVLLLDEPLGALDPIVRSSLQSDLKQIFQRLAKTVVLVTHDMAEAGYLSDRIVLMRDGQIVQQGTLTELQQTPADPFVSEFISAQRSLVQL